MKKTARVIVGIVLLGWVLGGSQSKLRTVRLIVEETYAVPNPTRSGIADWLTRILHTAGYDVADRDAAVFDLTLRVRIKGVPLSSDYRFERVIFMGRPVNPSADKTSPYAVFTLFLGASVSGEVEISRPGGKKSVSPFSVVQKPPDSFIVGETPDPALKDPGNAPFGIAVFDENGVFGKLIPLLGKEEGPAVLGRLIGEGDLVGSLAAGELSAMRTPVATACLVAALRHERDEARLIAWKALQGQAWKPTAPEDEAWASVAAQDFEAAVRQGATAVEPLLNALGRFNIDKIQVEAADALGRIRDSRALDPLLLALQDQDYTVRAAAARNLANFKDGRLIDPLLAALKDTFPGVRLHAAQALGEQGDSRAVGPLLERLSDSEIEVISAAERALDRVDPNWPKSAAARASIPALIAAFRAPSLAFRFAARRALPKIDPDWPRSDAARAAVPDLIAALENTRDADAFAAAAEALGRIGDERTLEPLARAFLENPWMPSATGQALGRFGVKGLDPLLTGLASDNHILREGAVQGLGRIGGERVLEPLLRALKDKSSGVREAAALALGGQPGLRARDALFGALTDPSRSVRVAAAKALQASDPQWRTTAKAEAMMKSFVAVLADRTNDGDRRSAAAEVLGTWGDPSVARVLVEASTDANLEVRKSSAEALGDIGRHEALEPLVARLKDDNNRVRQAAASSLKKIGDLGAVQALLEARTDRDPDVRQAAGEALEWIDSAWPQTESAKAAIPVLAAALKDKESSVREAAVRALTEFKDERAVDPLLTALKDEDWLVARHAAENLGRFSDPRIISALIAALNHSTLSVAISARAALDRLDPQWMNVASVRKECQTLASELKRNKGHDFLRAATSLALRDDERALNALLAALNDEEQFVRQSAARALQGLPSLKRDAKTAPAAVATFWARLRVEDRETRRIAVIVCGSLGDASVVEPLAGRLGDGDQYVQEEAAWALGNLGDREAVPPLIRTLESASETDGVRQASAKALGVLGDPRAIGPLFDILKNPAMFLREEAARALGGIGQFPLIKLAEAMNSANGETRSAAAIVLGYYGGDEALNLLKGMLNDTNDSVRYQTVRSIRIARLKAAN